MSQVATNKSKSEAAGSRQGSITGLGIATDHSVNCSSVESIVADVCHEGQSDQEKAVAIFDFVRRLMFHYANRVDGTAIHDTLHLLNTYGYSLCSQQALLLVHLWQTAGLNAEVWGMPHHGTAQVYYDGSNHWFDPLVGGYVYRRDGKTIASLEDIAADPSVLLDAPAEGRAPSSFMPCATVLKDDAHRFSDSEKNLQHCDSFPGDLEQLAAAAAVSKPWEWGGPSPSTHQAGLTIREGEAITFLWDYIPGQANCLVRPLDELRDNWVTPDDLPPHHFCGHDADERDPVNAPFFRPYVKPVAKVVVGRYSANGTHVYEPDLSRASLAGEWGVEGLVTAQNQVADPGLRLAQAGSPGLWTCRFTTPHVYTGGRVVVDFARAKADDIQRVYVTVDANVRGKPEAAPVRHLVWDASKNGPQETGADAEAVRAVIDLTEAIGNHREVEIEIECATTGKPVLAGVRSVRFEGVFQHNMFARPYLVPGRNRVTVNADPLSSSAEIPVRITYQWMEGEQTKTDTHTMASRPSDYTIDVAGEDLPRMVSLAITGGRE